MKPSLFQCLLCVLGLLGLCVSCARVAPVEPETLYGFELGEFEDIPATDIAFRVEPAISKQDLVQASSQLMADALRSCRDLARTPRMLDEPRGVELVLRDSKLARAAMSQQKPSPISDCLLSALSGKAFNVTTTGEHTITIQVRRHFELP